MKGHPQLWSQIIKPTSIDPPLVTQGYKQRGFGNIKILGKLDFFAACPSIYNPPQTIFKHSTFKLLQFFPANSFKEKLLQWHPYSHQGVR